MSKNGIESHVEAGDYFGTLATILDLLRQKMDKRGYVSKDGKILEELRDDLLYLQSHHSIK